MLLPKAMASGVQAIVNDVARLGPIYPYLNLEPFVERLNEAAKHLGAAHEMLECAPQILEHALPHAVCSCCSSRSGIRGSASPRTSST